MANITYFVALPFIRTEEGDLVAGEAQERYTANAAIRAAESFARVHPGAVAFSRTGDSSIGEFADADILARFGDVPSLSDLLTGA